MDLPEVMIDGSQITFDNTQEIDDNDVSNLEYFGYVRGNIVGLRYYHGLVSNKEMVAMVREPFNPYDCNAVRVNNLMGQQVGHIKREMARALAQVVDRGLATIEGLVPFGANNVYSMAVDISFWGDPVNKNETYSTMKRYGYPIISNYPQPSNPTGSGSKQQYTAARSRATKISSDQMKNELDGLFEKLKEIDQSAEEDACSAIKSNLYLHQKQALCWMRKREEGSDLPPFWEEKKVNAKTAAKVQGQTVYLNTITNHSTVDKPKRVKGGILADDMGLGKTLVTISLILGNSWNEKPIHKIVPNQKTEIKLQKVPVVARVNVSFGSKLSKNIKKIDEKKITENTEPSRRQTKASRPKRATKRPNKYIDELEISDDEDNVENIEAKKPNKKAKTTNNTKVDDEYIPVQESKILVPMQTKDVFSPKNIPQFVRESAPTGKPRATLIVCPLSLIGNWVGQVEEHVYSTADVNTYVYHGPNKSQTTGNMLSQQDIVVTTYQTVAQEMKRAGPNKSKLLSVNWLRIVLDEGHIIRNSKALQSQACCVLKSERKWVLTGTPIQNSTKDLYSIVSFLSIDSFKDRVWWQRTIDRPINNGDTDGLKRIRCLLSSICIRRTKQQKINGKPIINMPKKEIFLQTIDLDTKERELYDKMDRASKQALRNFVSDGTATNKYADMLVLIMRLRQICCHPSLAKAALEGLITTGDITRESKELATKLLCLVEAGGLDDCCICLDSMTMPVITKCSHVFCKLCICGVIANNTSGSRAPCPLCRTPVREEDLVETPTENDESSSEVVSDSQQSSKVNALMYEILKLKREQSDVKSLVVSQFTKYLKIIESHLVENNIPCVLYHGGMTRKARDDAIWQLQSGHAKVMLLTLKAGGVGLNLTAASQVFLMEPSWNPAAEDQCFDRVYRLGQTKQVRITKFVCNNTVEETMLDLQARKRELAKASLKRRSSDEKKKQSLDDLRRLMGV